MFFNRCFENENNMNNMMVDTANVGCCGSNTCPPVMECPQERVCHRQMCYDVPQVCPFM